jgi:hypothetical protein
MSDDQDRKVTIDIETATETVTQQQDIERIRREAGVEEGEPPPRDIAADEGGDEPFAEHGEHDHRIDQALQHLDGPQPG